MGKKNSKVLVAVPCGHDIPLDTFSSFMGLEFDGALRVLSGSLIDDSRQRIGIDAIKDGYDYVMWIDSDMVFGADYVNKLIALNKDVVTGICTKRTAPFTPAIYTKGEEGFRPIVDVPVNEVIEVDACGFAFCLTKVSALKKVQEEFGTMFARAYPLGEDLSFCSRWKALDKNNKIYCDTSVVVGHVGTLTANVNLFRSYKKGIDGRDNQK